MIDLPRGSSAKSSDSSLDLAHYRLFNDKGSQRIHILGDIVEKTHHPAKHQLFVEKQKRIQDDKPMANLTVFPSPRILDQAEYFDQEEDVVNQEKPASKGNLMVMYDSETSLFDSKEDFEYKRKKKRSDHKSSNHDLDSINEVKKNYFDHRRRTSINRQIETKNRDHHNKNHIKLTEDYIGSGGAPLRTSFQSLPKRESKRLSVQAAQVKSIQEQRSPKRFSNRKKNPFLLRETST